VLALVAALVAAPAALGEVRHVFPGQSIQDAIDASRPGDTIRVHAGVFRENLTITTNRLTLVGAGGVGPGPRTILRPPATPSESPCTFEEDSQVFVAGICAVGKFDPATFEPGAPLRGTAIRRFVVGGFSGDGVIFFNANNSRVTGVQARHNGGYGITGFLVHIIRFARDVVHHNGDAGFYIGDSPDADAVLTRNVAHHNLEGFLLRDASHGMLIQNRSRDNCAGVLFIETGAPDPSAGWLATQNVVRRNNEACEGHEGGPPPLSGVGIAIGGSDEVVLARNRVIRNRPSGETAFSGGIVVFATNDFGGDEPNDNRIRRNFLRQNLPADLIWDGTGTGNRFFRNDCRTSDPPELCG
jgi:hypothetical protein